MVATTICCCTEVKFSWGTEPQKTPQPNFYGGPDPRFPTGSAPIEEIERRAEDRGIKGSVKSRSHVMRSGAVWTGISVNVVTDFNEFDYIGRVCSRVM